MSFIQTSYPGAVCPACRRKLTFLLQEDSTSESLAICFHCKSVTALTGDSPKKTTASTLTAPQQALLRSFVETLPEPDTYKGRGSQLRQKEDESFRRRWLSLAEYERQFGETLAFGTPDLRTAAATCKWCSKALPPGRRSFCKDSCSRNYTKATFTKRSTPAVPYRIACRDGFYCGVTGIDLAWHNRFDQRIPANNGEMAIHHLIPVSKQGTDHEANLITLSRSAHLAYHRGDSVVTAKLEQLLAERLAGPSGAKMCWL